MVEKFVNAYLRRIGIDGPPAPNSRSLKSLQRAHLLSVPYDNLLPYLAPLEDVSPRTVVDRIVRRRMGGTRSQLNVGFAVLLHSLGYLVSLAQVHARTSDRDDSLGAAHLAVAVNTPDGRLLADVSGALADAPLPIESGSCELDTVDGFAIRSSGSAGDADVCVGSRRYTVIAPARVIEIPAGGWLASPDEASAGPVISVRRQRGRTTLTGSVLTETVGDSRTTIALRPEVVPEVLRTRFGVYLDDHESAQLLARYR